MMLSADNVKAIGLGVGMLALGWVGYKAWSKAGAAVDAVGDFVGNLPEVAQEAAQSINPTNPENIFYSSVNKVGGAVTSDTGPGRNADGSWTLGGWIYDVTHPSEPTATAKPRATTVPSAPSVYYDEAGNVIGVY